MSWSDMSWLGTPARLLRLTPLMLAAGLLAGCFQPMYGEHSLASGGRSTAALSAVDVKQITAPNGTPLARLAVEVRNDLLFNLTGGSAAAPSTHELEIRLTSSLQSVIIDINTARSDIQNYGIDATYTLKDLATDKIVVRGRTFARVAFDTPGQQQRFVGTRAMRDAEDRAAKVIADQIHSRLASYFVAGT